MFSLYTTTKTKFRNRLDIRDNLLLQMTIIASNVEAYHDQKKALLSH